VGSGGLWTPGASASCLSQKPKAKSQKPRPRCTTSGRLRPKSMQKRHSICSSKPTNPNTPRPHYACKKIVRNSWHSSTSQRSIGKPRRLVGAWQHAQGAVICTSRTTLARTAIVPNVRARQRVPGCRLGRMTYFPWSISMSSSLCPPRLPASRIGTRKRSMACCSRHQQRLSRQLPLTVVYLTLCDEPAISYIPRQRQNP
jgi:hypothetical protein